MWYSTYRETALASYLDALIASLVHPRCCRITLKRFETTQSPTIRVQQEQGIAVQLDYRNQCLLLTLHSPGS